MRCPYCGRTENRVIDSRLSREAEEIRRRRECEECGRRFTTRERVEEITPKLIKRDERREDYERQKLVLGIQKACEKRAVSADAIERLADRVERHLQEVGEKEVPSALIGERVMEELKRLDPVAAARFASVFRNFQGVEDYTAFFAELESAGHGRPGG